MGFTGVRCCLLCSHSSCFNVDSVSSRSTAFSRSRFTDTPPYPPPHGCSLGPQANRGFVSKWAEKLLKTSKKWFSAPDQQQQPASSAMNNAGAAAAPPLPSDGSSSGLINASAASRAAAMGQGRHQSKSGGPAGGGGGGGGGAAGSGGTVSGGGGGGGRGGVVDPADRPHAYDADSVLALSELLGVLLRRWGTGANASNQVMQARVACVDGRGDAGSWF